jgi:hypothetical protein
MYEPQRKKGASCALFLDGKLINQIKITQKIIFAANFFNEILQLHERLKSCSNLIHSWKLLTNHLLALANDWLRHDSP